MRTITIQKTLYRFNELSDKAKEKALYTRRYIFVGDSFWYEHYKNETQKYGATKFAFDIDRGNYCDLGIKNPFEFAKAIVDNHGENCDTYKLAKSYLDNVQVLDKKINSLDGETYEWYNEVFRLNSEIDDLSRDFIHSIQKEYLTMLRREYEHLTSDEYLAESFDEGDCEFEEGGQLFKG